MKIKILLAALFVCKFCLAQNVKIEIIDYYKKIEGKEFSTYQFANASYSSSRASIFFITPKNQFNKIISKVPGLFSKKQEYTDVWVLGIDIADKNNLSEIETKIVNDFYEGIAKYRTDNNLPHYDLNSLNKQVIYLDSLRNLCRYLICSKTL
jgi:hypothetical protein